MHKTACTTHSKILGINLTESGPVQFTQMDRHIYTLRVKWISNTDVNTRAMILGQITLIQRVGITIIMLDRQSILNCQLSLVSLKQL